MNLLDRILANSPLAIRQQRRCLIESTAVLVQLALDAEAQQHELHLTKQFAACAVEAHILRL